MVGNADAAQRVPLVLGQRGGIIARGASKLAAKHLQLLDVEQASHETRTSATFPQMPKSVT
jgi:hypothetical protein